MEIYQCRYTSMLQNPNSIKLQQIIKTATHLKISNNKQHDLLSQYFKLVFTHFKKHNRVLERLRYFVKVVKRMGLAQYLPEDSSDGPAMGYSPELRYIDGCKLSSIDPHVIENLPNAKCLACTDHLVRNYPIEGRREEYQQPIIIMNESNFFEEEIKSAICGLCNVGGGYIFYAKKSIANIIKQGFTPMSRDQLDKVKAKVRSAFECIRRKENAEVVVQAVQLDENIFVGGGQKMQVKAIENSEQEETVRFVFRIRVSIKYATFQKDLKIIHVRQQQQLFLIKNKQKNNKQTYKIAYLHKVERYFSTQNENVTQQNSETVIWQPKYVQNQYNFILCILKNEYIYGEITNRYHRHCKNQCLYSGQQHFDSKNTQQFSQVVINIDQKYLINETVIFEDTAGAQSSQQQNNVSYMLNPDQNKILSSILEQSFQKQINYNLQFPPINLNQTVVLFQYTDKTSKIIDIVQDIFEHTKTKYKKIKPFKCLQQQLKKNNKQKSVTIVSYELQYFIFEGIYSKFNQELKKSLKKNAQIIDVAIYEQITGKFNAGMIVSQQQLQILDQLLFDKFETKVQYSKVTAHVDEKGLKSYKNLGLSFNREKQRNVAVCAYVLFYFGKKRPKSS